jgi:hypothetical protein
MLTGDTYGAIVIPLTSLSQGSVERACGMGESGKRLGKPVCLSYASGWLGGPSTLESEMNPNLQCFQSIDRCFATLAAWHKRDDRMLAEGRNRQHRVLPWVARRRQPLAHQQRRSPSVKRNSACRLRRQCAGSVVQSAAAAVSAAQRLSPLPEGESPQIPERKRTSCAFT